MRIRNANLVPGAVIEFLPGRAAVISAVEHTPTSHTVTLTGWVVGTKGDYRCVADVNDTVSVIGLAAVSDDRYAVDFGTAYADRFVRHIA